MNSFSGTLSFYSEGKGNPITLSSFLQLSTDQLMTMNQTVRYPYRDIRVILRERGVQGDG